MNNSNQGVHKGERGAFFLAWRLCGLPINGGPLRPIRRQPLPPPTFEREPPALKTKDGVM